MLEIERIRELIQLMTENDITEVSIKNGDHQIELRRADPTPRLHEAPPAPTAAHPVPAAPSASPEVAPPAPITDEPERDDGLAPIVSPMVGTFYAAPDPNSPPYVTVGSEVAQDSVVCLVEAMKVFNEIKADVAGTIEKILVSTEEGVDYGQRLFLVRPRK